MVNDVRAMFKEKLGYSPDKLFFAPGRVNLIGEHTDYNGGCVFPCAITMGMRCAASVREDLKLRLYSENFSKDGIISLDISAPEKTGKWTDYPAAVVRAMKSFGYTFKNGADMVFYGDLPDGAGLSSSAALEVLTAAALDSLFGFGATAQEIALIGQFAENRFIGVNCGIMDQFASALGKKDNALLLDTNTLEFSYAPIPRDDASIMIVNSKVKHSLASSAYNDRRRECEAALADLKSETGAPFLCALSIKNLEKYEHLIRDDVCKKRARHAVSENERTTKAAAALRQGDLAEFGRLMNASHESLSNDYEVSCAELDFLAYTAQKLEGVLGARMTGGGFGGCTVNLVKKGFEDSFRDNVSRLYNDKFGIMPDIYEINAENGAGEVI